MTEFRFNKFFGDLEGRHWVLRNLDWYRINNGPDFDDDYPASEHSSFMLETSYRNVFAYEFKSAGQKIFYTFCYTRTLLNAGIGIVL